MKYKDVWDLELLLQNVFIRLKSLEITPNLLQSCKEMSYIEALLFSANTFANFRSAFWNIFIKRFSKVYC